MKCATLLHVIGPDALEIFNMFSLDQEGDTPGDDKKLDKVLSKFEKYCSLKSSLRVTFGRIRTPGFIKIV